MYRVKVVAKDWFGNGEKTGVTGKFEFIQDTPFSPVKSSIMLKGLNGVAHNYHVHTVSTLICLTLYIGHTCSSSFHLIALYIREALFLPLKPTCFPNDQVQQYMMLAIYIVVVHNVIL